MVPYTDRMIEYKTDDIGTCVALCLQHNEIYNVDSFNNFDDTVEENNRHKRYDIINELQYALEGTISNDNVARFDDTVKDNISNSTLNRTINKFGDKFVSVHNVVDNLGDSIHGSIDSLRDYTHRFIDSIGDNTHRSIDSLGDYTHRFIDSLGDNTHRSIDSLGDNTHRSIDNLKDNIHRSVDSSYIDNTMNGLKGNTDQITHKQSNDSIDTPNEDGDTSAHFQRTTGQRLRHENILESYIDTPKYIEDTSDRFKRTTGPGNVCTGFQYIGLVNVCILVPTSQSEESIELKPAFGTTYYELDNSKFVLFAILTLDFRLLTYCDPYNIFLIISLLFSYKPTLR